MKSFSIFKTCNNPKCKAKFYQEPDELDRIWKQREYCDRGCQIKHGNEIRKEKRLTDHSESKMRYDQERILRMDGEATKRVQTLLCKPFHG